MREAQAGQGAPSFEAIDVRFIPKAEMRQPGWGDWWFENRVLHIRAINDEAECNPFLVALHEIVEAALCSAEGVSGEDVDRFDLDFEAEGHNPDDEPGDDPRAPYRTQHRRACLIEFLMAQFMGLGDYGTMR